MSAAALGRSSQSATRGGPRNQPNSSAALLPGRQGTTGSPDTIRWCSRTGRLGRPIKQACDAGPTLAAGVFSQGGHHPEAPRSCQRNQSTGPVDSTRCAQAAASWRHCMNVSMHHMQSTPLGGPTNPSASHPAGHDGRPQQPQASCHSVAQHCWSVSAVRASPQGLSLAVLTQQFATA